MANRYVNHSIAELGWWIHLLMMRARMGDERDMWVSEAHLALEAMTLKLQEVEDEIASTVI